MNDYERKKRRRMEVGRAALVKLIGDLSDVRGSDLLCGNLQSDARRLAVLIEAYPAGIQYVKTEKKREDDHDDE